MYAQETSTSTVSPKFLYNADISKYTKHRDTKKQQQSLPLEEKNEIFLSVAEY